MAARRRLDLEMVRRGLAPSRARAVELVDAKRVTVGGAMAAKASRLVDPGDSVAVVGPRPAYVGRGGEKLAAALDRFGIDPSGLRVIDVGSSTGGFTDCLLQRGAREAVAIDVGRNQLHERLRADSRVALHERTDVRSVDPADVGGTGDIVAADLSFISLEATAVHLVGLASPGARLLLLVKPQFEAGKAAADRGRGVIRDPDQWRRALIRATGASARAGAAIMGVMVSVIKGRDGNVEFFVHARAGVPAATDGAENAENAENAERAQWVAWIDAAVAEAAAGPAGTAAPGGR